MQEESKHSLSHTAEIELLDLSPDELFLQQHLRKVNHQGEDLLARNPRAMGLLLNNLD